MPSSENKQVLKTLLFFTLTLITTTLAGAEWMFGRSFIGGENRLGWSEFFHGLEFSLPFLAILTVHEFGHYFMAQYYKLKVRLPFYIPLWLGFIGIPSIGTGGAFIKIESPPIDRKSFFDVGIAGPLAGFVLALIVLWYGFTHLPPPEFIFSIHPEYAEYGLKYAEHVYIEREGIVMVELGDNLLFKFFREYIASDPALVPNQYEIFHYPFIFAGYLALVFTSLNLLPIGQLDGGHVIFGLFGNYKHSIISPLIFILFLTYAAIGQATPLNLSNDPELYEKVVNNLIFIIILYFASSRIFPEAKNNMVVVALIFGLQYSLSIIYPEVNKLANGWLLYALIVGRFLGIYHPPVLYDTPLSTGRKVLGWFALFIFVTCFTPNPIIIK